MQASAGAGRPEREPWNTVEELCDRHLGGRPSEAVLQLLKKAEPQRPEVRDFLERAFRLMAITKFDPRDLSPAGGTLFCGVWRRGFCPGLGEASCRPSPCRGGTRKSMRICGRIRGRNSSPGTVLLDLGCGFPPQTSVDAADSFPDWQIVGADPAFEPYLLYDETRKLCFFRRRPKSCGIFNRGASKRFFGCMPTGCHRASVFRRRSRNYFPVCPPMMGSFPPAETRRHAAAAPSHGHLRARAPQIRSSGDSDRATWPPAEWCALQRG